MRKAIASKGGRVWKGILEIINFLKFQSYLGTSMPSRELPQNARRLTDFDFGFPTRNYYKTKTPIMVGDIVKTKWFPAEKRVLKVTGDILTLSYVADSSEEMHHQTRIQNVFFVRRQGSEGPQPLFNPGIRAVAKELKKDVVAGLLIFSGENLYSYIGSSPKELPVEKAIGLMATEISNAMAALIIKKGEGSGLLETMGGVAMGLLGSPNDNLKRAKELSDKKKDQDMFYYFALACYVIAKEVRP